MDHRVAGLQRLVVADQHLQGVGPAAGDGDLFGRAAHLAGDGGLGGLEGRGPTLAARQHVARPDRVGAVHRRDLPFVFVGDQARHHAPVAGLQVMDAWDDIVVLGQVGGGDGVRPQDQRLSRLGHGRRGKQGRTSDNGGLEQAAAGRRGGHLGRSRKGYIITPMRPYDCELGKSPPTPIAARPRHDRFLGAAWARRRRALGEDAPQVPTTLEVLGGTRTSCAGPPCRCGPADRR